ncbi:AAA family ATPase [Hazenella coriacea]|uniref:Uncharacterized AAA domain-containing protein ycf46 n=1 Tax=Hazenella coriacea TaxID=1179467 RepID=A0A4R3LBL6_9BACL|nr:AAA family ATPase [Hazenella coriacea]TCS96605.1 SpoVK/Ycf46/Vps4 family AAA+-type ATPase [Hazenella coriacea]
MSHFEQTLANLLKARFPFLYIPTWEEDRLIQIIHTVVNDLQLINTPRKVMTWSVTTGMTNYNHSENTTSPLKALQIIENTEEAAIFILKDFHIYLGHERQADPQIIRKIRDLSILLKNSANPKNVIFISPSLVLPDDLQKEITILDFPLPSYQNIQDLLDDMIATNSRNGRIQIRLTHEEKERLAKAALGLTLQEAENAFARALVEDGTLSISDVQLILEEKSQVIKKSGILEFIQTDIQLADVGGLQNLKHWLKKRNKSWLDSAKLYGLPSPKGILITGVPGCGKSLIAKAISAMWQLPLLRLDIGKVYSGIVGSSEENMRKAIQVAEAIAPSILWIDEIEKGFSNDAGDSGTSKRVFGSFLTWMQEKTKPVFVVATANQIHSLPSEFLRKGRFDEIFFVDLPTRREREIIFRIHLQKRLQHKDVAGDFEISPSLLEALAQMTEGFIGAEIEQVVISALFEAFYEERALQPEDLVKSIRQTVPLSVTQAEQIKQIRDWANLRAVAATKQEDRMEYSSTSSSESGDISATRGGRSIDF